MGSPPAPAPSPRRRWRWLFLPLGARLVGLFIVVAAMLSVTFLVGQNMVIHGGYREYLHPLIMNYGDMLVAEIGSPPDIERARALTQHLPLRIRIEGPAGTWDSADEPRPPPPPPGVPPPARRGVVTLPNGDPIPLILPPPPRLRSPPSDADAPSRPLPPPSRMSRHMALHADVDPTGARIVRHLPDGTRIVISLADMSHEERLQHVGWMTLGVLLALTGFAYAVVRHMLRPLVALRAGAIRYGQGDFSQPIVPRNRDELGDLAEQINAMAARLHHMLDAKRQLLLAISHELRSPLARARLNVELIDDSPERAALLRDLGEMRDLVTDLLESERLADVQAGRHAALQTEPTTLAEIVHAQCDGQAAAGVVALELAADLPALPLDRARMRLLVRNLVDNALRHGVDAATAAPAGHATAGHAQAASHERDGAGSPAGAPSAMPVPRVSTFATRGDDGSAQQHLVVRDHGPGMDESQLAHASEAFYRADAARQRSTGGVGLGLYLCKLVAEAHGGSLAVRNAHPGLEIEVVLPAPAPGVPA